MDAEKEKPVPENDDDKNKSEIPPEKPDPDQELPESSGSGSKSPSGAEIEKDETEKTGADEVDEKTETAAEEELPPSPFDLKKVSEEIDEYIAATLSKNDDDENDAPPNLVERFGFMVETKTADYDSSGDGPVRWTQLSEEDSALFLESISRTSSLLKALSKFSSDQRYASSINLIGGVLQRAMSYVEEEFKSLVEDYKIQDSIKTVKQSEEPEESPQEEAAAEEENYSPGYSEQTLSELIRLSKSMMDGGHELECRQAFFAARRNALEDSLQKLGFEKYSIDDVQKMQWESLEKEIVAWIRALKLCTTHFSSEHKLWNTIFPDEALFCNLSKGVIIQLLNFSGAVALTKRSSEKLFKLLDTYEALRDNLPTLDSLFPEKWINEVKTEASIIKGRLGESIISIFAELESSIKADSGKTPVPGGAVHPLTRYTMNYLKLAGVYKETLEQVYREHQKIERADSATGSDFNYNSSESTSEAAAAKQSPSPFQAQMIKLMDTLDQNLDGKSKLYKDISLSSIFMMNNGRYIVQRVRGSDEMNSLMGDSWCRKKSTDLRQYHKVYQRETWGKLLSTLHPEGLTAHGKVVKPVLKERFKSFNAMFDEIHRTQTSWVVCDEQLQSELRVSISNMVIPAYRSFLARYAQVFTPGRQTEKYVKYQGEDIETYIDELFDGNAAYVHSTAEAQFAQYHLANTATASPSRVLVSKHSWRPLKDGTIKINTDVSVRRDSIEGASGLAMDYEGAVLWSFKEQLRPGSSVDIMEARVLRRGVAKVRDKGYRRVVFATDSLPVIQALKGRIQHHSYLA